MRRRTTKKERRLAGVALALALAWAALGLIGFSCTAPPREERRFELPRGLAAAPDMRVALVAAATRALPPVSGEVTSRARGGDLEGSAVLEVRGPYEIHAGDSPPSKACFAGSELRPTQVGRAPGGGAPALVLGGSVFRPAVARLVAREPGTLVVNGTAYRGELVARVLPSGGLLLVNRVNLEEYVAGVVGGEMPALFPEDALRAQAIVSRTYGVHAARAHERDLFDVTDDTQSQVYRGIAGESARTQRAVADTTGAILTYGGRVFEAYFHSTCGGETIPAAFVFGSGGPDDGALLIPPLGGSACGFCSAAKYYRWSAVIERSAVLAQLRREGLAVRAVQRIEVLERAPNGHVATVRVVHPDGELRVRGTRLRAILGASVVRSTSFEIEDGSGGALIFRGRGFGHGVGMCQCGAKGMAEAGFDTMAILRRYYPAAEIVRMYAGPGRAAQGGG